MKVLEILKSRIGAISRAGMISVGLAGGMVALNVYNYATDKPEALAPQIRSLSQIMTSGSELPREYSGINLSSRGVDFATAEEQAQYEGDLLAKFDGGDAQVDALDKLDALNVKGSVFSGGEAGLGFNQAAVEVGPNGVGTVGVSGANGAAVGDAVAAANQTVINKLGEANGSLPRASMAKVNAGGSSSNFSPYGTAGSAAKGGSPSRSTAVGPSSISGAPAMEGTTLVHASSSLKGATGSDFVAASRNVSYRGGGLNSKESHSLYQIARQSATVAKHAATASANEHGQVFMAADQRGLGMQAVGDTFDSAESSIGAEDFEKEMDAKEGALDQALDEIDTTEQEKEAHRSRLVKELIALIFTTFAAMMAIASLMTPANPGAKLAWWNYVLAAIITAAVAAFIGIFIADAVKYCQTYENVGNGWIWASSIVGLVMAGGIAIAWIGKTNGWLNKVSTFMGKGFGQYVATPILNTVGVSAAGSTASEAIQDWNKTRPEDLEID